MHHWQPARIPRFRKLAIEARERNIFTIVLIEGGIVFALRDEDDAVEQENGRPPDSTFLRARSIVC
jgi:hypothetical protein